jgi:hypothetical protein
MPAISVSFRVRTVLFVEISFWSAGVQISVGAVILCHKIMTAICFFQDENSLFKPRHTDILRLILPAIKKSV